MIGQRRQVVGIVIHVMAAAGLAGAPMAAAVMGDHAKTLAEEEEHLRVPIVRRERPAMAEHDGLTRAPVLVEDLDAVRGGDRRHVPILSLIKPKAPRWKRYAHDALWRA